MLKGKGFAIAIAAIAAGLGAAATAYPQYAVVLTAIGSVLAGLTGQMAHNAQPPGSKS